eukprot:3828308-Amphidinium_carterae.2
MVCHWRTRNNQSKSNITEVPTFSHFLDPFSFEAQEKDTKFTMFGVLEDGDMESENLPLIVSWSDVLSLLDASLPGRVFFHRCCA